MNRYSLYVFLLLFVICLLDVHAAPYSIQFGIPECKIVHSIPHKDRDFAFIIPGQVDTYIYTKEDDYYRDYQRSLFAVTCKKAGWDCMRHYEILANGCIPYFLNLDDCDPKTMPFLPRELIKEAMNLEGVSYLHIDHSKFNRERYDQILNKLLEHTRKYLTTKQIAKYILDTVNYSGKGKILFLSGSVEPDYLRCTTLIGLKELLGNRIVDVPKIQHIYRSYSGNIEVLYGRGMSYTKIIDDRPLNRGNILKRILNKEFDLIIYGSVHRGMPFHSEVLKTYAPERIVYICGEDGHICSMASWKNFFLREYESYQPN